MGYNKLYQTEVDLFGTPYEEFETFIALHAVKGGKALDIGSGQGRDTLMLAQHGYNVVGVDSSKIGVKQMLRRAEDKGVVVKGVVADFYEYELTDFYDAIVLDSILHFGKADLEKESALLNKLLSRLTSNGFMFIFVHKSSKKERILHNWIRMYGATIKIVQDSYIHYDYEEKHSNFKSSFQLYMLILQRIPD